LLLLLEKGGIAGMAHNSPEYLHLFTECVKAAMADREYHFGDPRFVEVPLDRLLVETDAPFLAPVPHRGKRNEPSFVAETARVLAQAKGVSFSEVAEKTTANVLRAFNKMPPVTA
jgi:gamma-glutamyltranspeptidase